jgi:hypothetical protein
VVFVPELVVVVHKVAAEGMLPLQDTMDIVEGHNPCWGDNLFVVEM